MSYQDGGKIIKLNIAYLNKDKNHQEDRKHFKGKDWNKVYGQAVKWGKKNLDNFHDDMINMEVGPYADGGEISKKDPREEYAHIPTLNKHQDVLNLIRNVENYVGIDVEPDLRGSGYGYYLTTPSLRYWHDSDIQKLKQAFDKTNEQSQELEFDFRTTDGYDEEPEERYWDASFNFYLKKKDGYADGGEIKSFASGGSTRHSSERKSPTDSATWHSVGTQKVGNDGNTWAVKANKNDVHQWRKVKGGESIPDSEQSGPRIYDSNRIRKLAKHINEGLGWIDKDSIADSYTDMFPDTTDLSSEETDKIERYLMGYDVEIRDIEEEKKPNDKTIEKWADIVEKHWKKREEYGIPYSDESKAEGEGLTLITEHLLDEYDDYFNEKDAKIWAKEIRKHWHNKTPMWKRRSEYGWKGAKGGLTPEKAQLMLDEGTGDRPLTEKQKRYFHWVASGKKSKYADGGKTQGSPRRAPKTISELKTAIQDAKDKRDKLQNKSPVPGGGAGYSSGSEEGKKNRAIDKRFQKLTYDIHRWTDSLEKKKKDDYADGGRVKGRNNKTGETYGVVVGSMERDYYDDGETKIDIRVGYSSRINEYAIVFDKNNNLYQIKDFGFTLDGTPPSRGHSTTLQLSLNPHLYLVANFLHNMLDQTLPIPICLIFSLLHYLL